MTASIFSRPLLLLLVLVASSLLTGTNAANIMTKAFSADGSMIPDDCLKEITHPGINVGIAIRVEDAISDLFAKCIDEGSNGKYEGYELEHNTGALEVVDVSTSTVDVVQNDATRRLPTCPPSCGGWTCGSNCNLCCMLCGTYLFCGGHCYSCRRRLGTPEEAFEEEMRKLSASATLTTEEAGIARDCLADLRAFAEKLNSQGNRCLGNWEALNKVLPIIS
jgi:hypothetical protein